MLTKEKFGTLANFDNRPVISIYMPTSRAGKDVMEEKDRIQLKSQWKKVYVKLKDLNLSQEEIDELGKPVENLLNDSTFWRYQSDGLALFIAKDYFEKFTLPIDFEPQAYVSDHFYLKPLVPLLNEKDENFYLLSLQIFGVKLFRANRYEMEEVKVEDLPSRLEDRVGYDYEEKNLMHETQNSSIGSSTRQGVGGMEKDQKNEYLRFFRAVDKSLHNVLNNKKEPLVVACQDYLFSIYQEANTYKNLYPRPVNGNPSDFENEKELHKAAFKLVKNHFEEEKMKKKHSFRELTPKRKSADVSAIIPAIYEGKVDTLFLKKDEDLWGNYNENMASVEVEKESNSRNISLMNLAATKVVEQNGNVYLFEEEFMPEPDSKINAIFRY